MSRSNGKLVWSVVACVVAALGAAQAQQAMDARLQQVDPLLRELEKTSAEMLNVARPHGELLRLLAEMRGAKRALEIGTSNGYSAIWLGLGLERAGGKLTTVEIVPERSAEARQSMERAGLSDVVTCVTGDALEVIPDLEGTFDFVFIDALKSDYWRYFELVRPKLRQGAVVVAHNAISAREQMARYLEILAADPDLLTTVVAIEPGDGMAITYWQGRPEEQ